MRGQLEIGVSAGAVAAVRSRKLGWRAGSKQAGRPGRGTRWWGKVRQSIGMLDALAAAADRGWMGAGDFLRREVVVEVFFGARGEGGEERQAGNAALAGQ